MEAAQLIHLTGDDERSTSVIHSSSVSVFSSPGSALDHEKITASNKVKMKPVVKFFWEYKYYSGKLICCHKHSPLVAYCIESKGCDNVENTSMVRIRNTQTTHRLLLKSFCGKVATMAFAATQEPVLAVLDKSRTLHVFKILDSHDNSTLTAQTMLVFHSLHSQPECDYQTLSWCPWIGGSSIAVPLKDKTGDLFMRLHNPSMLLAFSCGNRAEVLNLKTASELFQARPSGEPSSDRGVTHDQLLSTSTDGESIYAATEEHADVITVSSLSRDASCLATSCLDGKVRIFCLLGKSPHRETCMTAIHSFSPHDGLPLHGLIFLDSDVDGSGSKTWSHLVTGAQYNRELRLWSCDDWSCVQTVNFCSGDVAPQSQTGPSLTRAAKPTIIMDVDWSKSVLVASDITRRVLYVLTFTNQVLPTSPNTGGDQRTSNLRFASISEFVITMPCILFALGTCDKKRLPFSEQSMDSDTTQKPVDLINLEIHCMHTWHLLNGTITFEVPVSENLHLPGPTSQDNGGFPHSPDSLLLLAPDFAASADQLTDVPPTVPQQQQQSPEMPCSDVVDNTTVCQPAVEENSGKESQLPLSNMLPPELTEADKCLTPSHPTSVPSDPMIETELMFHEMERRLLLPDSLCVATEHDFFQNTPLAPNSHAPGSPLATDAVEVNDNPKIPDTVDTQRTPALQLESIEDAMLNRAASAGLLPSTSTDAREQSPTHDPLYDKLNLLGALLLTPPPPSEQEHPGDIMPEPRLISPPETNRPLLDQDFLSCPDPSQDSMQDDTEERGTPSADLFPNFGEPDALGQQLRPGDSSGPPHNLSEVCGLGGKYPRRDVNWSTVSLCSSSDSVNGSQTPVDRVPLELTTFTIGGVGTDTPRALSPTTMGLLRSLVEQSQRHSQQMESVLARLSETQSQLSSLQQSHSQLLESLRRSPTFGPQRVSNSQSSASLFSEAAVEAQTPGSRQSSMQVYPAPKNKSTPGSTDECVIPNWGKQVLLQLRTQQGDFAKRFTQMEFLVNRLSSSLNELTASCKRFQPPTASTSQSSVRSDQLPKLLSDRMKPILKAELESAFANHIPRFIEPIQGTILRLVQDCSRSLPSALSDSLSHLLRDKNFCAQFSRTLSSSLTPDLCGAYRDSLQQCFVPALEKNLNRLFEELTIIFRAGTQQYLDEIKKHLPSTLDADAVASAVCAQLTSAVKDSITSAVLSLKADIHPNENKTLTHSSALASPVRATLGTTESVCITHRVGKAVVPSRAKDTDSEGTYPDGLTSSTTIKYGGQYEATPAPNSASSLKPAASTPSKSSLTKKEEFARLSSQALSLIREGRLVDALELALVSTNQRLVLDVCGDIEPDQLFSSGNTQIGQNILLSLIHQLSCGNLSDQLDLKLRYLHEAVLSLNVRNSTTIEHGPRIIGLLSRRLEALLLSAASASGSTKLTPSTRARIDQLNQAAKNVSESINPG